MQSTVPPARLVQWQASLVYESGPSHLTKGDILHLGLKSYSEAFPCPNGLPVQNILFRETPAGARVLAKARRDIEEHRRHIAMLDDMDAFALSVQSCVMDAEMVDVLAGFRWE